MGPTAPRGAEAPRDSLQGARPAPSTRDQRGFLVSGIGIPVGVTGAGIAFWGAFVQSAPLMAFGANMVGVGIAANVTGAVVGMRSMTLYDRELKT